MEGGLAGSDQWIRKPESDRRGAVGFPHGLRWHQQLLCAGDQRHSGRRQCRLERPERWAPLSFGDSHRCGSGGCQRGVRDTLRLCEERASRPRFSNYRQRRDLERHQRQPAGSSRERSGHRSGPAANALHRHRCRRDGDHRRRHNLVESRPGPAECRGDFPGDAAGIATAAGRHARPQRVGHPGSAERRVPAAPDHVARSFHREYRKRRSDDDV